MSLLLAHTHTVISVFLFRVISPASHNFFLTPFSSLPNTFTVTSVSLITFFFEHHFHLSLISSTSSRRSYSPLLFSDIGLSLPCYFPRFNQPRQDPTLLHSIWFPPTRSTRYIGPLFPEVFLICSLNMAPIGFFPHSPDSETKGCRRAWKGMRWEVVERLSAINSQPRGPGFDALAWWAQVSSFTFPSLSTQRW